MKKLSPMLLLLTISFFSLNNACRKSSEPTLPDATQSGANTAGCLLNGQLWIADASYCMRFGTPDREKGFFSYDIKNQRFEVIFKRCTQNEDYFFSLSIEGFLGPGRYECNQKSYIPSIPGSSGVRNTNINYHISRNTGSFDFVTSEIAIGSITITKIDTLSRPSFAAGTFECKLKNLYNMYDSLVITSGRFDIINQ